MKKNIGIVLTVICVLTLSVLGIVLSDFSLTQNQLETWMILGIVCGSAMAYCFIVGEITHNFSQMDKLWSLLPIAYAWIVAGRGGMKPRLIVMAAIITLWGMRLTFNFARKGAYKLKFWQGEEDYRWAILRQNKIFQKKVAWSLFDLFFISIYQNLIVLAICLPTLAVMESGVAFGPWDYLASTLACGFLCLELIADEQQWKFHQTKKRLLKEGKALEELDAPYNLGFNTIGLWGYMRHPNYLGEQGIWLSLYVFVIGAGVAQYGVFHWSVVGSLFLVFLFLGSSNLGESISSGKYPKYQSYIRQVPKYFPLRKFNPERE